MKAINDKLKSDAQNLNEPATIYTGPPVIRVTLASVEETSMLLSRGLDFYGATYFPTETPHPAAQPLAKYKNNRWEVNSFVHACFVRREPRVIHWTTNSRGRVKNYARDIVLADIYYPIFINYRYVETALNNSV